ncbi:hypothetical protein [Streptomyces pini]|uniref:Uncharacterized protein n=1 Tax=Streptomyces pini TaxID=1520580 RepID=A0A1I4MEY7_9ACTN|nr:hypothetical protein [Streptomyces pini]SFM01710.1 hypothetical protein SAMN05192584_14012 [Streptomyces pini]
MSVPLTIRPIPAADDACPLCGYWRCRCSEVLKLSAVATDSDPDMEEALRRVRAGGRR